MTSALSLVLIDRNSHSRLQSFKGHTRRPGDAIQCLKMAKHIKIVVTFIPILFSLVVFGQEDKEPSGYMRREHSLVKPFSGK